MDDEMSVVPGQFSSHGRATSKNLAKLWDLCTLDAKDVKAASPSRPRSTPHLPGSPKAPGSSPQGRDSNSHGLPKNMRPTMSPQRPPPLEGPLSPSKGRALPSAPTSPTAATPGSAWAGGLTPAARGGASQPVSPAADGRGRGDVKPLTAPTDLRLPRTPIDREEFPSPARPSTCFTSLGMDVPVFCETARANLQRFVFPMKFETRPDPGQYQVRTDMVHDRPPAWDFSERPRNQSKKPQAGDDFLCSQELGSTYSSFSSATQASKLEQMTLASARPDLAKISLLSMTEAPPHYTDWCLQDEHSSQLWRRPLWDFQKHTQGRKDDMGKGCPYFEPGKYNIRYDAVESPVKIGPLFEQLLSRAQTAGNLGFNVPKALLVESGQKPDRSLYRGGLQTQPRVVNVNDFAREIARPPLTTMSQVYYDETDPEASAAAMQHLLEFDASTADRALIPRRDLGTPMARVADRDCAFRGSRMRAATCGGSSAPRRPGVGEDADLSKDGAIRVRRDLGVVAFGQQKGRSPARTESRSSLRQPRGKAAPDFARHAPCPGFTTRVDLGRLRAPGRSWASKAEEESPPPSE